MNAFRATSRDAHTLSQDGSLFFFFLCVPSGWREIFEWLLTAANIIDNLQFLWAEEQSPKRRGILILDAEEPARDISILASINEYALGTRGVIGSRGGRARTHDREKETKGAAGRPKTLAENREKKQPFSVLRGVFFLFFSFF